MSSVNFTPKIVTDTLAADGLPPGGDFPKYGFGDAYDKLLPLFPNEASLQFFLGNTPVESWEKFKKILMDSTAPTSAQLEEITAAFAKDFANLIYATPPSGGEQNNQEPAWAKLTPPPAEEQFINWFNQAAASFPTTPPQSILLSASDLLITTAVLNKKGNEVPGSILANATVEFPSFQDVYEAFFPPPEGNFQAALQQFYTQQLSTDGFLVPSQSFGTWVHHVQQQYAEVSKTDSTSLREGSYHKTIVINKIYELIATLISVLQRVAASHANRLTLLTNWQQAYSNELGTIHTFLKGKGGATGTTLDLSQEGADTLNTTINAPLQNRVQTNQSVVGDDGKSLQSVINQDTEAVSQQANHATSLLQLLSTLLSAIYR